MRGYQGGGEEEEGEIGAGGVKIAVREGVKEGVNAVMN